MSCRNYVHNVSDTHRPSLFHCKLGNKIDPHTHPLLWSWLYVINVMTLPKLQVQPLENINNSYVSPKIRACILQFERMILVNSSMYHQQLLAKNWKHACNKIGVCSSVSVRACIHLIGVKLLRLWALERDEESACVHTYHSVPYMIFMHTVINMLYVVCYTDWILRFFSSVHI